MEATGDPEKDRLRLEEMHKEVARLQRNKERRLAREKMKKRQSGQLQAPAADDVAGAGSPSAEPKQSVEKAGTTRKCANCGQAGHIKTNKKYFCSPCALIEQSKPKKKTGPKRKVLGEAESSFQPRWDASQKKPKGQSAPKTKPDAAVPLEEVHESVAPPAAVDGGEESEEE